MCCVCKKERENIIEFTIILLSVVVGAGIYELNNFLSILYTNTHTHTFDIHLLNILEHWNVRWVIAVHCYVVVSCLYMRRRDIYLCTQQTHFSHNSIWLIWLYLLYFKYNCLWLSLITRFCAIQIDNRKHLASHGVAMCVMFGDDTNLADLAQLAFPLCFRLTR